MSLTTTATLLIFMASQPAIAKELHQDNATETAPQSLSPEQTLLAPELRQQLPALPTLTGSLDTDLMDMALLDGQVMVINVWYEW